MAKPESNFGHKIHAGRPIRKNLVLFLENGNSAKLIVMNKKSGQVVKELVGTIRHHYPSERRPHQ